MSSRSRRGRILSGKKDYAGLDDALIAVESISDGVVGEASGSESGASKKQKRNRNPLASNMRQLYYASVSQRGCYKARERQGCDAEQAIKRAKKAAWHS